MKYVGLGFVFFLLLYPLFAFCAPPHPVVILWVGAEEPGGSSAMPDIGAVRKAFENRGYRALRVDGASPETLRAAIAADRAYFSNDYHGAVVSFVVHGRGVLPGNLPFPAGSRLDLPLQEALPVHDEELIAAFLDGIGDRAKGEIMASACFTGAPCRDVDLKSTPFRGRVTHLIVTEPSRVPTVTVPEETPEERVLAGLLQLFVDQTTEGQRELQRRHWNSAGPLGALEQQAHGAPPTQRGARGAPGHLTSEKNETAGAVHVPLLVPDGYLISAGSIGIAPPESPESGDSLLRKLRLRMASETSLPVGAKQNPLE